MTAVSVLPAFKGEDHADVFHIGGTCWVRRTAFNTLTIRNIALPERCFSAFGHTVSASHKNNPSSLLRVIVDSYTTLPWVTWEDVTSVEVILCLGLLRNTLANGAMVYPSQGGWYRAEGCISLE